MCQHRAIGDEQRHFPALFLTPVRQSMHPKLLKTFLAVARHRNFTRAAEDVHLAQSSVSDQIQSLEAELGASLFERSKRGLELTPAGEALRRYADEILALTEEARTAVAAEAGQQDRIRIGTLETVASTMLPEFLSGFQKVHPSMELRLSVAGSGDLLRKLEEDDIDVAVSFDRGDLDERFVKRTVQTEPVVLITPATGSASRNPGLHELASLGFVATEVGCVYRSVFDKAFADAGLAAPKLASEVGSIGTIVRMVAAGAGFGLVPRLAVIDALGDGTIREMPWPGPTGTVSLVMIWRRRRVQPSGLRAFLTAASDGFVAARPGDDRLRRAVSSLS